jgi:hypothetical protein
MKRWCVISQFTSPSAMKDEIQGYMVESEDIVLWSTKNIFFNYYNEADYSDSKWRLDGVYAFEHYGRDKNGTRSSLLINVLEITDSNIIKDA